MSETHKSGVHPLMAVAAVAVIIFSAVGIGVMTGVIPTSKSEPGNAERAMSSSSSQHKNTEPSRPRPATRAQSQSGSASSAPPAAVASASSAPPAAVAASACLDCGVVEAVNVVESKGEGSGLGAAGGAVVGGIVGNQVGSGRGNTAATVVGAVGGAVLGNEVEKRVKKVKQYDVTVRMHDGELKRFTFPQAPAYAVGDKVKVVDGKLTRNS